MTMNNRFAAAFDFGAWLIVLPWLFDFNHHLIPMIVSLLTGLGIIVNSLFSNLDLGAVKFIPEFVHYVVDIFTALFLCLVPWLFDYEAYVVWPHFLTGAIYLIVTLSNGKKQSHQYFN